MVAISNIELNEWSEVTELQLSDWQHDDVIVVSADVTLPLLHT